MTNAFLKEIRSLLPMLWGVTLLLIALGFWGVQKHHVLGIIFLVPGGSLLMSLLGFKIYTCCLCKSEKKIGLVLGVVAVLMFMFSFAMIPLFHVVCSHFGIHGKVGMVSHETLYHGPPVHLHVVSTVVDQAPIQIEVENDRAVIAPKDKIHHVLHLKNRSDKPQRVVARLSIAPNESALFLSPIHPLPASILIPPQSSVDLKASYQWHPSQAYLSDLTLHYAVMLLPRGQNHV